MDDPRLEQAFDLIRQVVADAKQRGADELLDRINSVARRVETLERVAAARDPDQETAHTEGHAETVAPLVRKRGRARKGLVREVVTRELAAGPPWGFTPSEIAAKVRTDEEKMISASSFRSELRAGGEAGIYKSAEGGRWVLVREQKEEKAGWPVQETLLPASSSNEPEGR